MHLRGAGFLVTIEETGAAQLEAVSRGRRRAWGDDEFLGALATLSLTDTLSARSPGEHRGRDGAGPIIAVMGDPERETVDWMLRQRRPGDLAVAFLVRTASALDVLERSLGVASATVPLAERLADAGWLVVPVRADDDHAAAWEAVVVETGRARGSA